MMDDNIFSKLDICNTNVDKNTDDIKAAKKSLNDAKKDLNTETGRLINELCREKEWYFKDMYVFLMSLNMPIDELSEIVSAYTNPCRIIKNAIDDGKDDTDE